jgi:hypothetical protein
MQCARLGYASPCVILPLADAMDAIGFAFFTSKQTFNAQPMCWLGLAFCVLVFPFFLERR